MYSYFIRISDAPLENKAQIDKNLPGLQWQTDGMLSIACSSEGIVYDRDKKILIAGQPQLFDKEDFFLNHELTLKDTQQWKGSFAFASAKNKKLEFTIGNTGLMQGYIAAFKDAVYIFSELKLFSGTSFFERKMIPIDSYRYTYTSDIDPEFSFLQNVKRIL